MQNGKLNFNNRRTFLKKTTLASAGVLGLGNLQAEPSLYEKEKTNLKLPKDLTILFQGDSITDAGRKRDHYYANDAWGGLGSGYVLPVASELLGKNPTSNIQCYNRGISGHKVFQLAKRWEEDCLQIQPDVLSILIGVNDFWHTLSHGYKGTARSYEDDFRKLLDRTLKQLPDCKIIVCEPFVVKGGSAIVEKEWFPAFMAYQNTARKISSDYNTNWVPFQKTFDDALEVASVEYWCPDGVHPSLGGGYLMAEVWLDVFKKMMK
jgi:lysophospholipase L1-like esterase